MVSPKESGRKGTRVKKQSLLYRRNLRKNKHSRSLLKCVLTNDGDQTAIYVTCEVHGVRFIESQKKKTKLLCLYHESVRNSVIAGVSFSQNPIASAADLDLASDSECP